VGVRVRPIISHDLGSKKREYEYGTESIIAVEEENK